MAGLIAARDWSASLGPIDEWPGSLKTTVGLLLHSPVPIVLLWGEDGIMLYNDAYSVFAGVRHPHLLGSKVREGWPEVADFNDNVMRVGLAGGTLAYKAQELTLHRSGRPEPVWMNLDYSPVIDESGAPGGVIAIVADITEQVLADTTLRETERRLQLALSAGRGIGTWDWDVVNDRVYADARFADLYGVDPEIARNGASIAEFFSGIHPDDVDAVQAAVGVAIRTGAPFSEEYRLVQSDGSSRWVVAEGRAALAPDGAPVRFPGVSFDISDRKRVEARVATLLELTDALRDVDDPDEIAFTASAILGKALEVSRVGYEVIDTVAETVTIERDWNAPGIASLAGVLQFRDYGSYIENLAAGETVAIGDAGADQRTRDGVAALRAISAMAFVNMPLVEQGRFVALLYVNHAEPRVWTENDLLLMRDVAERVRVATERVRAEAALQRLNETLEEQVAERTSQLMQTEEALRQAQKMEAVGQLTGGLAHDFNNLLAGISGSLELLEKRIGEGRLSGLDRYIGAAQSGSRRAAALTQRLLAFARRQTLDPRPTDVNKLVAGMEDLIRRTVAPTVAVEVVGAGGLWPTRIDPSQLENSLLNLCLNARDAMAPDGGRLTIETANKWLDERAAKERELPPGQYVSLCVSDTGTGMTAEVIARAFDPFFTTKPLGQGTGLGLSMIYGFVRQSGGQVRIYSEPGKGTTMCLYLPRHIGGVEDAEDEPSAGAIDQGDGETVLVIDDEPTVRMLIVEVLEENGYVAIEAGDGPSGLRILESDTRIDLLITDVGLPGGLNGRQVADAARQKRPALKVLFITGYAENAAVGNGHLDPGMEVITKPFVMASLGAKIRDLIDR